MDKEGKITKIHNLGVDDIVSLLEKSGLEEFVDFIKEKQLDGRKLLGITEGVVKLWRPKSNANKLMNFIEELRFNPEKFLENEIQGETVCKVDIEAQYQTVTVRRKENLTSTSTTVEELLKKMVPSKSFLYRNQSSAKPINSYVPMDAGTPKKTKKFFRLSSYDYPDIKKVMSKNDNFNDQGYYCIKTDTIHHVEKTFKKQDRTKYKTLSTAEELSEMFPEEHFYEDLNYTYNDKQNDLKDVKPNASVKSSIVKFQEMLQNFKLPFFKKVDDVEAEEKDVCKSEEIVKVEKEIDNSHIYENSDSLGELYDIPKKREPLVDQITMPVEDYLEPKVVSKEYCDVVTKEESLFSYLMNLFEQRLRIRRETSDTLQSEDTSANTDDVHKIAVDIQKTNTDVHTNVFAIQKTSFDVRNDVHKFDATKTKNDAEKRKTNMADRPLPVPVENEPYYMDIDRSEAENLLKGQPDGTFVLRPSSQPNHAYTLTVSCSNAVHNVGVRRRPDGRLALGYARRGERCFTNVSSLLRHHKKRRLLLVAGGTVCGATTLNDTPQYYQTPSNLPLPM